MGEIKAPMAGKIVDVKVNVGDAVSEKDEVVVLEAMKMEVPIFADASGTVKQINCKRGDAVPGEFVLMVIE